MEVAYEEELKDRRSLAKQLIACRTFYCHKGGTKRNFRNSLKDMHERHIDKNTTRYSQSKSRLLNQSTNFFWIIVLAGFTIGAFF